MSIFQVLMCGEQSKHFGGHFNLYGAYFNFYGDEMRCVGPKVGIKGRDN